MSTPVRAYQVNSLSKVDVTNYRPGDLFITRRSIGILANGAIHSIPLTAPDLSNHVTKQELKKILKKETEKDESI